MYDVTHLRETEFPHAATLTYLNHAGISPLPQRAKREIQAAVEGLSADPADYFGRVGLATLMQLQTGLTEFIHAADPSEIVFVSSTSAALNAIAQAIVWQPGDRILFCDLEFPSNVYPWLSLQRDGVESTLLPADGGGLTLAAVERAADERTRVVAASAVQFFTGHRTDLAAIGDFCHRHNILFVVDAIQAIGHTPFDVQAMNIDVLATGGQKSLLGLPGVGFMYVRSEVAEAMQPRLICSNGTADYLHWLAYDLTPLPGAARFQMGTPNVAGMMGLAPSLALLQSLGVANIDAYTTGLSRYACEQLTAAGLQVITPADALGPIVTFRSPVDSAATDAHVQHLAQEHVAVVKHLDAAGAAYIRLSFHAYNVPAEVDRFLEVYQRLIAA